MLPVVEAKENEVDPLAIFAPYEQPLLYA